MDEELLKAQKGKWCCYLLRNTKEEYRRYTYNGSTNDLFRRLRQHNGEISGGARHTSKTGGGWEVYCFMTGFEDHVNTLQAEWRWKHPTGIPGKRPASMNGVEGRIRGLNEVIGLEQWTSNSVILNKTCQYELYIKEDVAEILDRGRIPENVQIIYS
jgi:predicted GIY-YIG superfamily endonuclease